jgi:hypothetical protein
MHFIRLIILSLVCVLAAQVDAKAALPQSFEADLDKMVAANEIGRLMAFLEKLSERRDIERAIAWLKDRSFEGAGFDGLPFLLAKALHGNGQHWEAAFWLNYGRALILVDGQRCTDRAAFVGKLQNTLSTFGDLDRGLMGRPSLERNDLVERAVNLELRTRDNRKPDRWLCEGGLLDEARKKMKDGQIPIDPRYFDEFVDDSTWVNRRNEIAPYLPQKLQEISKISSQAK